MKVPWLNICERGSDFGENNCPRPPKDLTKNDDGTIEGTAGKHEEKKDLVNCPGHFVTRPLESVAHARGVRNAVCRGPTVSER